MSSEIEVTTVKCVSFMYN